MKLRLFTRQGVTLMLGDAVGKKPDGTPLTVADIQRMLGRGEVCVESGEEPSPPTVIEANLHQPEPLRPVTPSKGKPAPVTA
jgi:acetamidase/formamidase